ncbi:hypothetical protein C1H71_11010 [Iodobacter fluviatilis]|jgi:hypothetical protein|uniref:Uncharacterized protein n=1 Tax=Iodobacter fluviatilis TaxID=537 RepID=A0A7G3GAA6_9NEIS|nr:hypothetical protein C1H71_11010 [Iodobacter fluviatilis]
MHAFALGSVDVSFAIALSQKTASSLSDLSDRSEGKTGLRQISRVFEANSWLFNEKMREIWPNPAFP